MLTAQWQLAEDVVATMETVKTVVLILKWTVEDSILVKVLKTAPVVTLEFSMAQEGG